jgi:hypothetical protein
MPATLGHREPGPTHRIAADVRLVAWDSGETELDLVDLDKAVHVPQHRIISTPDALDDLINQQLIWRGYPSSST